MLTVWLAGSALCMGQMAAKAAGGADSGVFDILSAQHRVGTESFEIKPTSSGWDVSGELQLDAADGAKASESIMLKLDPQLRPLSYLREKKSPASAKLEVRFNGSDAKEVAQAGTAKPLEQEFFLPETDLAILDTNVFHQYALLLRLYDPGKGGSQPFNVFVPQESLPGTVTLQQIGKESVSVGRETLQLDHYEAVTEQLQIEIWATADDAIYRISIPSADLDVVRR